MSEQPEDFAAEAEVDDSTRLAVRRQVPDPEPDDSTQLATRRASTVPEPKPELEPDDSTQLASRRSVAATVPPESEVEDSTRLTSRRTSALEDDVTQLSGRHTGTMPPQAGLPGTQSVETQRADRVAGQALPATTDLPPDSVPIGMHVRAGGFGTRTEAYRPRDDVNLAVSLPPAALPPSPSEHREPVLTPLDAQKKRESAQRASITKVVVIGVTVLVLGSAAVIGILLLVRGLL